MFSLLQKLKSILLYLPLAISLVAVTYGWYWHSQYKKQLQENASCTANIELLQSGVQRWKAAAAQYDEQLKRREAQVAKTNVKSKQKIQTILQTSYPQECNQAIQTGLQKNHAEKISQFHWHNNIP